MFIRRHIALEWTYFAVYFIGTFCRHCYDPGHGPRFIKTGLISILNTWRAIARALIIERTFLFIYLFIYLSTPCRAPTDSDLRARVKRCVRACLHLPLRAQPQVQPRQAQYHTRGGLPICQSPSLSYIPPSYQFCQIRPYTIFQTPLKLLQSQLSTPTQKNIYIKTTSDYLHLLSISPDYLTIQFSKPTNEPYLLSTLSPPIPSISYPTLSRH